MGRVEVLKGIGLLAKLTDPQLMKGNKVTYPRESRIAGHTKKSNMAEDRSGYVEGASGQGV